MSSGLNPLRVLQAQTTSRAGIQAIFHVRKEISEPVKAVKASIVFYCELILNLARTEERGGVG